MRLNIYGSTPIMAPRDPIMPMEVTTKNYVDNGLNAHIADVSKHLTEAQNTWIDSISVSFGEINYLTGVTSSVQTQLDSKVSKSGSTMTGFLFLSNNPTENLHAATKQYVDSGLALKVNKAGDTMTGALTLSGDPTSALHAAPKQYVDASLTAHSSDTSVHLTSAQNTWIDAITASSAEVNQLVGVNSSIQTQIDSKVAKSGDTMTGALTLPGAPTANLHAATKQYVDTADSTKVAKAGDTMTGALTLSGAPTVDLHATSKIYVDSSISAHANDEAKHLTSAQNTWIDTITVSSTEVNRLAGVTSAVQTQIDTKFDKAGGAITGDVTLADGKAVFVSKAPAAATELVNKAYVDSKINGQEWKDPVSDINLVHDSLNTPPAVPVKGDVFIIGNTPTGAWVGKAGFAVYWTGTAWKYLGTSAVAVGDRFGVKLTSSSTVSASLTSLVGKLVTITSATVGSIAYSVDTLTPGSTTLVFDPDSSVFGVSYTLTDEGNWVPTNTSVNMTAGVALELNGNTINVLYDKGITLENNKLKTNLKTASGINFDVDGKIEIVRDGATLTASGTGVKVSDAVMSDIADKVSKTAASDVTASVTFKPTGSLKIEHAITDIAHATTKKYVDDADTVIQGQVTTLRTDVNGLLQDPVTKQYIDSGLALKVNKAGDTMTGALILPGDPTSALHAAPKQYVDNSLTTHTSDVSIHLTSAQNTWIDAITISSSEANQLVGITSNVQTQINAKVAKAGDVMTGALTLSGDPTISLHAATKQYVDAADSTKVAKAGDTMTGLLTLSGAPTANLHAATKQYVDTGISTHAGDETKHLTSAQNTWIDAITVSSAEVNLLSGSVTNIQTQIDSKVAKAGDTMTGALVLSGAPTLDLHAATKKYTDDADATKVAKAGDTMTGALTLSGDPTINLHASTKQYVDSNVSALTSSTTSQLATKVAKAGDTMTGALLLHADPIVDAQASTKKYVDDTKNITYGYVDGKVAVIDGRLNTAESNIVTLMTDPVTKYYVDSGLSTKVSKSGDTMTGYLTLHADPQQPMHAVSKQYVDGVAQGLETKPSIRLATTVSLAATYNNGTQGVNATLTGTANGALIVDGKTVNINDRILVKDQTSKIQNGDYTVQQVGSGSTPFILKRVISADQSSEIIRSHFFVYDGNTLKSTSWVFVVDNPITFTVGVDDINVNQFSGQGSIIAGSGLTINGNTIDINTANSSRIVVNADNIDLATTGVTPGNYTKVLVDGYGRVTTGSNPNTLAGYGITDGQQLNANLTSLSGVVTTGIIVRNSSNDIVTKAVSTSGTGLSVTNGSGASGGDIVINSNATNLANAGTVVARDASGDFSANQITAALIGNASTATTLATSRNFSITGDVVASAVGFNGSANVQLTTALTDTGVVAGTFTKVTVDAKGRITTGANPTTIAGYAIIDAYTIAQVNTKITELEDKLNELYSYVMSRI